MTLKAKVVKVKSKIQRSDLTNQEEKLIWQDNTYFILLKRFKKFEI